MKINELIIRFKARLKTKYINLSKKDYAFLHIPKTGGTYIMQLEKFNSPVIRPINYYGHKLINESISDFRPNYEIKNYTKKILTTTEIKNTKIITVIRNPFDWLVSYASHAGGWNPRYYDENNLDFQNANKGMDYLVQVIANRDDMWPSRHFPFHALFSSNGNLIADYIFHNETLDNDLENLAKDKKNLIFCKQSKMRIGKRKSYKKYFSNKSIETIYSIWPEFFSFFGYSFDNIESKKSIIPKYITPDIKSKITYTNDKKIKVT